MCISDWSSDVCSSDLLIAPAQDVGAQFHQQLQAVGLSIQPAKQKQALIAARLQTCTGLGQAGQQHTALLGLGGAITKAPLLGQLVGGQNGQARAEQRSEEHTSELQSLMHNT